jgi:g-D-glutamyl-meso-diaminopimelate peptidase
MKKILILLIILIGFSSVNFAVDMTKDYSSQQINEYIDQLENTYDEITVETLGMSYLGQKIKSIQLKNIGTSFDEKNRYTKGVYHFLVIGGIHGRERVNSKLLLKQIEYYAQNKLVPKNIVIHYIPLVNPDGYDLSLFEGLETEFLKGIGDQNYPRWKSNIRGVDINRNFPDIYLDLKRMTWKNLWGHVDNRRFKSEEPSGEFYFGPYAGSEIETQILMDYMNRYKFEMFLDYHSQGEVLYVDKWFMSDDYNRKSLTLAETIMDLNGYVIPRGTGEYSSGFSTNYMINRHRIPSITIETTSTRNLPYLKDYEEINAYEENKEVTLEVFKKAVQLKEFGFYKTYDISGYFFDDYENERIAQVYANKFNLDIKRYDGIPKEHVNDFVSGWALQSIEELTSRGILNIDLSKGYQSYISVEDFLESIQQINKKEYLDYDQSEKLYDSKYVNRVQASYIIYTYW